ncbi:hypothetical protein Tco_1381870 [Tanacetum coccineum]
MMLKVSHWKGVIRFGKKGKLAPRYVGPFEILERIDPVAYRLSFHVSLGEIKVDKTLHFVEEPVEIMDREVKSLKRSKITLVKVRWNSKRGPEFTWEREDYIKSKYPQLFVDRADESANPVMSSSSTVTYISVYTDSEPGRPIAPPSPDYVPGPKHPPSPDYVSGPEHPPLPVEVYVPKPEYPEYLVPADVEAPLEDQPLPADASPIALSPGYVADSDPEEDPEEDHADYLADEGDDDDEPSDDDDDDIDDEDEEPFEDEDNDKEEEHLALADSSAKPVVDPVPSAGDIEAFKTGESVPTPRSPQTKVPFAQTHLYRARKTVRLEPSMSPSMEARVVEYAVVPAPPSSLHLPPPVPTSLPLPSSPLPLPPSSLHLPPHVPTSLPLPSSPLPPLPSLLFMPPLVDRREDIPEAELPPCKRLCLTALTSRYEVGESSIVSSRPTGGHRIDYGFIGTLDAETRRQRAEEVSYGIRDVWVDPIEAVEEVASTTLEGVNARVTELAVDSYPDAGLPYRLIGVTDDDIDYTCFITTRIVVSGIRTDSGTSG